MTEEELVEVYTAWADHERELIEHRDRTSWEQTRWSTVRLVNLQLQRKDQYTYPQDFHEFPWDPPRPKPKVYTRAEAEAIAKKWAPGVEAHKRKLTSEPFDRLRIDK